MKTPRLLSLALLTVLPLAAQNGKPDAEGFIRDWLVLAPVTVGDSGAEDIDKKQFPDEAKPASAKEGGSQMVGDKTFTWQKVSTKTFYLDFREMHPNAFEHVAAWAVAYVVASADRADVTLKMNSNDQGKVYLNGKEVVKFTDTRTLEKDAEDSAAGLKLNKGVNVVVLKVINEENNWQGSLRFVDKAGKPITDLKIETKP